MINLDTLDTVIAIVIVLLVLSLIVQAIQSFLKKLFKIKSGTILTSLEDLFKYVDVSSTGKSPKDLVNEVIQTCRSPKTVCRLIWMASRFWIAMGSPVTVNEFCGP